MNPLAFEWVSKAEGDYSSALRELRARVSPNYDDACFHSQQLVEKYLKAFLQENGSSIPHTHGLVDLLGLCLKYDPSLSVIQPALRALEGYAVQFRYPGQNADRDEAKAAFNHSKVVRDFLRSRLGL